MIKFIAGGRRSGRTTEIIKMAEIENAYILVSDHGRASCLFSFAQKLGYHIRFPITFHEFWRGARNTGNISKLLIDDADDLLEHMARMQGWNLKAVSIQKEDNFIECEPMINIPEYKVGDEVIRDSKRGVIVRGPYPIVLSSGDPEYYVQIWYGTFMSSSSVRNIAPTGRHFDQVDFLLNEMNREINEGK